MKKSATLMIVGVAGLFTVGCLTWFVHQAPIAMTPEQEMSIVAGAWEFIDTDCQQGFGGCVRRGVKPTMATPCSYDQKGNDCKEPRWSEDDTRNRVCSTNGDYWIPGIVCEPTAPHVCQDSFTKCISVFTTHACYPVGKANGTGIATQCKN